MSEPRFGDIWQYAGHKPVMYIGPDDRPVESPSPWINALSLGTGRVIYQVFRDYRGRPMDTWKLISRIGDDT